MLTINEFSKRLCNERKRLKMTQANFAEACGVKPASQFLYEKAERSPNAEYLVKASDIGVRISYLFQGESARFGTTVLSTEDLISIYIECDTVCRDNSGKLFDLELRAILFRSLIEESTALLTDKIKYSA